MKDFDDIQASQRIRALRERRGFSRETLAELAGISSKFLYDIEAGNKGFSARTLAGLADSLDVSSDYIIFGETQCKNRTDIMHLLQHVPEENFHDVMQIINLIYKISVS